MNNLLKVLLIEDDKIEVMKLNRAISSLNLGHSIAVANNGVDALEILQGNTDLPDIILLDLNMPKINGIEFLTILKKNSLLQHIPTIILTTSANRKDIVACYKIGIAGYVLKPLKYEDYKAKIERVLKYWSCNELK